MNPAAEHVYTPSELNREIRMHLEMGFPSVLLEAEISNLARPASGHLYFSLKDSKAQVRCAMFRSAASRTKVAVENGMKVLAKGRISLYEARGDYQFIVDRLEDAGEGLLQRQFEALKKKLDAEGLFDASLKQPIPPYPSRIGLVTSPSGAAVRDLVQVLGRRWPVAGVRLYPVLVQGDGAPAEIIRAIVSANRQKWADVLIVGRGGGSLEDLVAFNDEAVARTVHSSQIPVISAVGHETDFSICDFVADLRAPTPSAAAELATPDQLSLKEAFARSGRQLERRMQERLQQNAQGLDHVTHRLQQKHPETQLAEQARLLSKQRATLNRGVERHLQNEKLKLDSLERRLAAFRPDRNLKLLAERVSHAGSKLERQLLIRLGNQRERLSQLARTLNAVSPLETIGRGYAILTVDKTGEVITETSQANPGDRVSARISDGHLNCTVDKVVKKSD